MSGAKVTSLVVCMKGICLAAISACVPDQNEPLMTYHLECVSDICEDMSGSEVWGRIGIFQADDAPTIYVSFVPGLQPAPGEAHRSERVIWIRSGLPAFNRKLTMAHEVGHVVLDTPEHTTCGVMGGVDLVLCDEDIALACSAAGVCQ